ncbi:MAG: endonuclease Q family protein [Candidatus Micrarchaeota archaeon]
MKLIADLHIHSKYARGCSPRMDIPSLAQAAKLKGIHLVGTGDFTHPKYFEEIKSACAIDEASGFLSHGGVFFVPTVETNNLFQSSDGKNRRVHVLVVMPDLESAASFSEQVSSSSKLGTDGRPWVRLSLAEMTERALSVHPESLVIPAHIWAPWYGVFGSKGGFGSLSDAFEDQTKNVHAIETGLSSDPPMNWRCKWLDSVQLLSFSDAHSPQNLGREASLFDLPSLSYGELYRAVRDKSLRRLERTYEFFPQEGKYFADGHADCQVCTTPQQTREYGGRCPKCGKKITGGVLGRIDALADRPEGEAPKDAPPYTSIVPLADLIAMALDCGKTTKKPLAAYDALVRVFGSEFNVLFAKSGEVMEKYDANLRAFGPLSSHHLQAIAEAIDKMQRHALVLTPGYDGHFGKIGLPKI